MNRLGRFLKGARMFLERRDGFYSAPLWGLSELVFIFFILSVSVQIILAAQMEGPTFGAVGRIEYRFYDGGKILMSETNEFAFKTHGQVSMIECFPKTSQVGVRVKTYEYSTDGKVSFFLARFDLPTNGPNVIKMPDGRFGTKNSTNNNINLLTEAFADVRPDSFPPNHIGFVFMPWLAFVSSELFASNDAAMLPILGFVGPGWNAYPDHKSRVSWYKSNPFSSNAEGLVEYADKSLFLFMQDVRAKFNQPAFPKLFEQGYTNAIYQVLSWTNNGNFKVPLHSRYTKFIPRTNSAALDDLDIQLTYDCFTTALISKIANLDFPRKLPNSTKVTEYRFSGSQGPPHTYHAAQGKLLTLAEIQQLEKSVPRNVKTIRIIVIITVLSSVPFILAFKLRQRRSGN